MKQAIRKRLEMVREQLHDISSDIYLDWVYAQEQHAKLVEYRLARELDLLGHAIAFVNDTLNIGG